MSGNGISSLGHPAKYAPNRPKAAPEAPSDGVLEAELNMYHAKEPPNNPMR